MWIGDKAPESSAEAFGIWGLDDAFGKTRTDTWPTSYPLVDWPAWTNSYVDATVSGGLATFTCDGQTIKPMAYDIVPLSFGGWEVSSNEGLTWSASAVANTPPPSAWSTSHSLNLSGLTAADDGKLFRFVGYSSGLRGRTSSSRNLIVDVIAAVQWTQQPPTTATLISHPEWTFPGEYYIYSIDAWAHGVGQNHGNAYGVPQSEGYRWQTRAAAGGSWANINGDTTFSGGQSASMGTPTGYTLSPQHLALADVGRQFRASATFGAITSYSSVCTLLS